MPSMRFDPIPTAAAALATSAGTLAQVTPFATPDTRRKLHLGHVAFVRAVVQGVDPAGAWDRYLQIEGNHRDPRTVRRTLAWIRNAFAAAARRKHRPGTAKLVAIDIYQLPPAPAEGVSLETFIVASGLESFSPRDQLAAFEHSYGNASTRQSRRARLMVKQLEALRWLEELISQPPSAGDPIVCWIDPDLSAEENFFRLPAMLVACDLIVSVETAVMHLANAVHVPVVALMHGKNPEWAPIDAVKSTVLATLHRRDWVKAITVWQVMAVLNSMRAR